ncbi:MAG: c-type cytochrome domain-containing protein [Verrucomicrobiales bacterium]
MITHRIPASLLTIPFIVLSATAEDPVNFEKAIFPILEAKCLKCHATEHKDEAGKVKKPKGGLVMDTAEGLTKGGKNTKGKVIVAGKPDESDIYRVVNLPASDDESMPPEGKADPLTDEEKALLKRWLTEGAKFGDWKGKK